MDVLFLHVMVNGRMVDYAFEDEASRDKARWQYIYTCPGASFWQTGTINDYLQPSRKVLQSPAAEEIKTCEQPKKSRRSSRQVVPW